MLKMIKNKKGFTLVELIIAMGVFVILLGATSMMLAQCMTSYQVVYDQSNYGAVTSNLLSTVRAKTASAYDVVLLPMSDDYSSELTFDELGKNKDFKNRETMDFEAIICGADGGITTRQISFNKDGQKVIDKETSQYTYEDYKKAVPIVKFKQSPGAPDYLFVDVRLYEYDSTYDDDGTKTYEAKKSKYGMNTEISCINSPTITSPTGETYMRAIVYRILE